jgi:hypothetical protein
MTEQIPRFDTVELNDHWSSVRKRINSTQVRQDPFPFIQVDKVFPPALYQGLLDHLPDSTAYDFSTAADYAVIGNETRRGALRFDDPVDAGRMPSALQPFWRGVTDPAHTQQLVRSLINKFRPHLQVPANAITPGEPLNIYGKWLISRDLPGYELPPHLDVRQKLVAGLFYLPRSEHESPYGTTLLSPKPEREAALAESDRHAREDFDVALQLPFRANTFFAFVQSDRSFHGVDTVGPEVAQRDILMFNVNIA